MEHECEIIKTSSAQRPARHLLNVNIKSTGYLLDLVELVAQSRIIYVRISFPFASFRNRILTYLLIGVRVWRFRQKR